MQLDQCVQPWFEMQIEYNDRIGCCCYYQGARATYNVGNPLDIAAYWNGPVMQKMRSIIKSGDASGTGCEGCQFLRLNASSDYMAQIPDIVNDAQRSNWGNVKTEFNNKVIEVESTPVKYYFNFGLACNIACIMCSQKNMRLDDKRQLDLAEELTRQRTFLSVADRFAVIGGEPLLIPGAIRFIETMMKDSAYANVRLELYSNATLLDRYLDRMAALNRVGLVVSIDGVGATYDHIRAGGEWAHTERNILEFKERGARLGLDWTVHVACILFNKSLANLESLVDWAIANELPMHVAPIVPATHEDAELYDIFRYPHLLDDIPEWQNIFERCIEKFYAKGWSGPAQTLKVLRAEIETKIGQSRSAAEL